MARHQHQQQHQCNDKGNTGFKAWHYQHQVEHDHQEGPHAGPESPFRLNEKIFVEDARYRVRQGQNRRHGNVDRRYLRCANPGCRGTDQNDLVPVLLGRNLAAENVVVGINLERRTTWFVRIIKSIHS